MRRFPAFSFAAFGGIAALLVLSPAEQSSQNVTTATAADPSPARPSYIAASVPDAQLRSFATSPGTRLAAPGDAAVTATPSLATLAASASAALAASPLHLESSVASEIARGGIPEPGLSGPDLGSGAMRVASSAVNVRSGPSTSSGKLFVLNPGEAVAVTDMEDDWAHVELPNGESGWVYSRYLTDAGPDSSLAFADPADDLLADHAEGYFADPAEQQEPLREAALPFDESEAEPQGQFARVDRSVTLRAGPSSSAEPLFMLEPDEQVVVSETRGRWVRLELRSGASGWVLVR